MKRSKIISLGAITTAISVVFLALGAYIDVLDLSCLFMASLMIMIPLSKKTVKCAILSYIATCLLSLLFTMGTGKFAISALYAVFFGFHPIVNYIEKEKHLNKILLFIIKDVWFIGTLLLSYYAFTLFTDIPEFVAKYALYIIIIGGAICFIAYDFIMKRFQYLTENLITRLKL